MLAAQPPSSLRDHRPLRRAGSRLFKAGIAVLTVMSVLSCTSSQELTDVRSQLQDLHVEILQLQKQSPTKDELTELGQSITEQIAALIRSEDTSQAKLNELTGHVAALETKLKDTNFRLTQLVQQIAAANEELQAVRSATETARRVAPPPPQSAAADPTDPQALYESAYNDYVRGNYDLAILSFKNYVEDNPKADLADKAAYWLGECYYRQGNHQLAIDQFDAVLTRFENSDKRPSALLRKGYAYFDLGQRAQGIIQLQNVLCEHAGTDEGHLARGRLEELGIDVECEDP
jgi:tol-pal system protein YbgF